MQSKIQKRDTILTLIAFSDTSPIIFRYIIIMYDSPRHLIHVRRNLIIQRLYAYAYSPIILELHILDSFS